ncbi:hypothetical protein WA026_019631 [Henosepilachna vigintioctopunctata]|uniref:Uncharacterized protein n=1 Tax=Henosepilachna vigintioctopunctata TaxID=420089 RepID=A0AAW1TWT0_9CUCU
MGFTITWTQEHQHNLRQFKERCRDQPLIRPHSVVDPTFQAAMIRRPTRPNKIHRRLSEDPNGQNPITPLTPTREELIRFFDDRINFYKSQISSSMTEIFSIRASPLPEEENELIILRQSESVPSAVGTDSPTLESVPRLVSTTKTLLQLEPLSSTRNDIRATRITPISLSAMDPNVTTVLSEMAKTNTNSIGVAINGYVT